ncbi:hypothetical protein [Isoptericola aurantiacus]|uniref:hypothetical protein n=1 Tax=Isoptericola aurantiacus TaxID=3377839 RepID=UPI00383AB460
MRTPVRPTSLGLLLGVLAATVGATVYVTAIGYLDLRASSIVGGALLSWDGSTVSVARLRAPVVDHLGIAVVTALAVWPLWHCQRAAATRWHQLPVWAAAATTLALIAWAVASTTLPYSALSASLDGATSRMDGGVSDPLVIAWTRQGALSLATPVFVGVLAVLALARPGARRAPEPPMAEVAIEDEPSSR